MKWLTKPFPKIIICFQQNGCMATELEFKWIGYVKRDMMSESNTQLYICQPLIKGSSEHRNYPLSEVAAYQIQHLGLNLYIHYT